MDLTLTKDNVRKVIIKRPTERKKHFFLGRKGHLGFIRVLRRPTNLYVMFEDLNHKIIVCKSSGSAGIIGTRRIKRVPQSIENIFNVILPYLKFYVIRKVQIFLNTRINGCFYVLLRLLEKCGIRVERCRVHRRIAFNGCKGRKIRRI